MGSKGIVNNSVLSGCKINQIPEIAAMDGI